MLAVLFTSAAVPSTCKAGSNGVLEKVEDLGNGKSKYYWKHRYLIDFDLFHSQFFEFQYQ